MIGKYQDQEMGFISITYVIPSNSYQMVGLFL